MRKSVYLCGPITGLSYGEARHGWREEVAMQLLSYNIESLSPMRAKQSLAKAADAHSLGAMGDPASILSCARGLTERDRFDTTRADLIFCNLLGSSRVSIGSMIEFGWADICRIPILCCMEKDGNLHDHAMVQELISFRCETIEEGIFVAKSILTPGA